VTRYNDKSDYNKVFMDLVKHLPETYLSDVNISLLDNLFNRFLTKQEIEKISGYIGRGNEGAITSRQIKEADVHRQAFQLQPILYDKIGTIEHMASWEDIQNELVRLGVDMSSFADWGSVQKFNWVPPIDINKLINYRDYYWVDSAASIPQYITIRSRCAVATSISTFWDGLISQYGSLFPIVDMLEIDDPSTLPTYPIIVISTGLAEVHITGDATNDLSINDFFDITGTVSNNGTYRISAVPVYDGTLNRTILSVAGLISDESVIGKVELRRFDKIALGATTSIGSPPSVAVPDGDYTRFLSKGFVLFLRNTGNTELNNSFVEVVSSEHDANNLQTIVKFNLAVTDNTFLGGEASLEEQQSINLAEKNCQCGELGGWDDGIQWDDNPADPLWGDIEDAAGNPGIDGTSDHQNLLDRISNPTAPTTPGTQNELWYDTFGDVLYQYDTVDGWVVIWNNFSIIIAATKGFSLWDEVSACDTSSRIEATDQWINQNKWLHKNDVTNFASAKRAAQPIIEYDWDLELNEWTYIDYRWSYRADNDSVFVETDDTPSIIELEPLTWWELEDAGDPNNTNIIFDSRYGDLTDWFSSSKQFYVDDGSSINIFEVDYSEYKALPSDFPYRTYVTLTTKPSSTGDLNSLKPNSFAIYPTTTNAGDVWMGYGIHWLFLGAKDAVPVPHQPLNTFAAIENGLIPVSVYDTASPQTLLYEYNTSLFSQSYTIFAAAGMKTFTLVNEATCLGSPGEIIETLCLNRKALFGFDDIRVYTSDIFGENVIRQYGNYDEIGEAVLDVIGIDYSTGEFVVGVNLLSTHFTAGDVIRLSSNVGIGSREFVISSTAPTNPNRIRIDLIGSPDNLTGVTINGEISNITTPLPGDDFTNSKDVTIYVAGVNFFSNISAGVNVIIEVGPGAIDELGYAVREVRTIEDNEQYNITGNVPVSQIQYRLVEQVKTKTNQYPLFDIFTVAGDPAFKANPIFGYKIDASADINQNTGLRIVFDSVDNIYEFDQFILDEDDGELRAYRDYSNRQEDVWYNPDTNTLMFWNGITWSDKTVMGDSYRQGIVSDIEPNLREKNINGLYWYLPLLKKLFIRDTNLNAWNEVAAFDNFVTDINLQTIWKGGIENDLYIPKKVDWKRRSKEEYDAAQSDFISTRVLELITEDPSLSEIDATTQATQEWYDSQINHLSPTGVWIGEWEIPDPLYYNNQHENRKCLTSRELLTHFTSIIQSQELIPGFTGTKEGMFNLLTMNAVNYAAGGTIKEFNSGFDTMLSSAFINNVTPRSLIEFAHDQYAALLNSLKEIYRKNALTLLTNLSLENILDLSSYVSSEVINQHELNDQTAFIYGDSTTFTDVTGTADLGIRNWIATLPYINLVEKRVPELLIDNDLSLNEVVHHDGHREEYALSSATSNIISQLVTLAPDPRTSGNTLGEISIVSPPNNIVEFQSTFGTPIVSREGVYYFHTPSNSPSVLYRYIVAGSGDIQPGDTFDDGTLWMDTTSGLEVLRQKNTSSTGIITWDVVSGVAIGDGRLHNGTDISDVTTATISAWQEVDLDVLLNDTVFAVENLLYENVPSFPQLAYDFDAIESAYPTKWNSYLEEAFLNYVLQSKISEPYKNSTFSSTDAFTWNYIRSASGGGINIISADGLTNSFTMSGNKTSFFTPTTDLFVKNSDVNDGTWTIISSSYNVGLGITTVYVTGDIVDSLKGIIYFGILPSNLNDGSETAGDWRGLYNQFYGTPYPHLEPWILQGYTNKPDWWDIEYLNDDVDQWGDRTWKYKHGFEIATSDNNNSDNIDGTHGIFGITGNFTTNFISGEGFTIDNSVDHDGVYIVGDRDTIISVNVGVAGAASIVIADTPPDPAAAIYLPGMIFSIVDSISNDIIQTYTIRSVNHVLNKFTITVEEEILSGDLILGSPSTKFINGVLYNPSTNLSEIKIPGLVASSTPSGRIIDVSGNGFGMWENIRIGVIPPGRSYPNGVVGVTGIPATDTAGGLSVPELPVFNYFSVNISNLTVTADGGTTTYNSDDLLPPYWNYINVFTATPVSLDLPVRSIYNNFSTEIISPNVNYTFGDLGPVEWEWRESAQFLYDKLTVAYRIDPVKFVSNTFGFDITKIGGLEVDRLTKNTPSHTRVDFHGEVVDSRQFKSNGQNQWYVNFNRYAGYDTSFSDFRELFTGWTAPLTYQFASFVDTPSLTIDHRYVDVSNFDFNITSKRSPGVDDFWIDAFKVSITNIPFDLARYDNHLDWRFDVNTNLNISRNIKYYDVHNYQFYANPTTDECWLYTWEIKNVDTFEREFTVHGNQTYVFTDSRQFDIIGSVGNDGTYDVLSSSYDTVTNTTTISVSNSIPSSSTEGLLKANYRSIPWETGDGIYLSTAETLPIPLAGDTVNGLTKYFIIKVSDSVFKIANTPSDAATNVPIDITSTGRNDQFVGEVISTFLADEGVRSTTNWRIYSLDKSNVLEFNTPYEVQGMQTLANIIQGYGAYGEDIGWKINDDKSGLDPDSSRIISWQVELERFITYAYAQRVVRQQINDRYPVTVDTATDTWTFNTANTSYITGDVVNVISSNGVYPTPLARGIQYYVIRDTMDTFRLSATKQESIDGTHVDILSTTGIGDLSISTPKAFATLINDFEINPFRNLIWFDTPRGIVSNIITGPVDDIRTTQLIFNQDGTPINTDQLRVYRQDQQTKISVVDAVQRSELIPLISSTYSLLHLGGLHLFIDAYEHVMILNNYNSDGVLLYDPFIGLNVTKYEMLFNRQPEFTQRPNIGGYYIETFFNQGANLNENIESSIESLRNAYDTYDTIEKNLMTQHARKTLGYEGSTDYLSNLNLPEKSQFIFWRGQIQAKGSLNAINAFINSRRFIDAKIDEFWAIKVADFGSIAEKEFPEMFVTTVDARSNELRLEFIDNDSDESIIEETFKAIKMSDHGRWYNQPDQSEVLRDNGKVMYFDMKPKNKLEVAVVGSPGVVDTISNNGKNYIRHDLDSDYVELTQFSTVSLKLELLTEGTHYRIVNNNIIEFIGAPYATPITIWGMVFNNDGQDPARIIDRESETLVSSIQFWDPARGMHYTNAIHNVDLQNDVDPAQYNNTPQTVTYSSEWQKSFVGTSWMNTENLDYVPYYSKEIFTDTTERFRNWGQLTDWSDITLYEWVESDVPPSEWDALAAEEEGDRTIVEHLRKSGIAKKTLFEDVNGVWIPAVNKFVELYAATDGVDNTDGTFTFSVDVTNFKETGSPAQYVVNVYVNGKLVTEDAVLVGSPPTYTVTAKESDIIRIVQLVETDQTIIDTEIAAGNLLQEYEYTQVSFFDSLGTEFFKYYFWVGNKGTKPTGKNRSMSIVDAQTQLATIPSAHMFFQEPKITEVIADENINITRSEIVTAVGSPAEVYYVDLPIAENTSVIVEINGDDVASTDISYTTGAQIITLDASVIVNQSDEVKITYTGVDSNRTITLPSRFTQAIVRGLQGIVNADDRYTIRYTRNFSLRDTLEVENENINGLDLKNAHEEWKIFRQEQQTNIDKWQWDRITESIVGYKLDDPSVRVPSYERELYDEKYQTDTQYGLGTGQAFVKSDLALASILAYLVDPDIDFTPLDINAFFAENSFDTPENIITAMDVIYNTFGFADVNRMYFSVLKDAFTTKAKYPGILKTSMISLHGIRPFQTSGIFDD